MTTIETTEIFQSEEHDNIEVHMDVFEIHVKNGPYGAIMLTHNDFQTVVDQFRKFQDMVKTHIPTIVIRHDQ